MNTILCDTSVVSDLRLGGGRCTDMADLVTATKSISVVTIAEMRSGALTAKWGKRKRDELDDLLKSYVAFGIDDETARCWADLSAECQALGVAQSDNDLWIAATSKRLGIPVASLDADFTRIPGLVLIDESGVRRST